MGVTIIILTRVAKFFREEHHLRQRVTMKSYPSVPTQRLQVPMQAVHRPWELRHIHPAMQNKCPRESRLSLINVGKGTP